MLPLNLMKMDYLLCVCTIIYHVYFTFYTAFKQFNSYLIPDPSEPFSEKEDYGNEDTRRKQVVVPFTMEDWRVRMACFVLLFHLCRKPSQVACGWINAQIMHLL